MTYVSAMGGVIILCSVLAARNILRISKRGSSVDKCKNITHSLMSF